MSDYGNGGAKDLVPGTLRGYRAWALSGHYAELRSISVTYGWYPGSHPPAACLHYSQWVLPGTNSSYGESPHPAPAAVCTCGYYATYRLQDLSPYQSWENLREASYVIGTVKAYGSVVLGTVGFRAQYMEIEALVRSGPRVTEKAAAYGVPTVPSFGVLVSQYPPSNVDELIGAPGELLQ